MSQDLLVETLLSILFFSLSIFQSTTAETFEAHCRNRPPELYSSRHTCHGPVADIVEVALTRIGHQVNWSTVPWSRTIKVAEIGGVDLIPRFSMNEAREKFLNAVPYGYKVRKVYFMIGPYRSLEVNTMKDLKPYRIGALRNSFYSQGFAEASYLNKQFYIGTKQLIKMLTTGRIDIAITSTDHDLDQFQKLENVDQAKFTDEFRNGRYFGIPKKSPKAKYFNDFKHQIEQMRSSGEVGEIFRKYKLAPPTN